MAEERLAGGCQAVCTNAGPPPRKNAPKSFKRQRDHMAGELDLDPSIIAPRATLEAVAARPETAGGEMLMPWQRALLGLEEPAPSEV